MADSPRIEELKRRVQSDPASIAFAALAEEYRRAERFDEAIATCTAGLVRHPSYLSAHVTLGRALIEVGRLDDAREELEYVLKLAPENLAAIRGLAEIHNRVGQDAIEHSQPEESVPEAPSMTVAEIQEASGASSPILPPDDPPSPAQDSTAFTFAASTVEYEILRPYSEPLLRSTPLVTPDASQEPALAGLEEFLQAILRARTARATAR